MSPDIESTLRLHIGRSHAEVPVDVKIGLLHDKKRRQVGMAVVNITALAAFGFAFSQGLTTLPGWVFTALGVVFSVNIGLLFRQRHQIGAALAFLEAEAKR
jgi:protein-S-isoprenylcysteine O-methyltransferase Ste14